jgi:quercetin dioxygenase-like cupin family protein
MTSRGFVIHAQDVAPDGWDDPVHGRIAWRTLVSGDVTPSDSLSGGIAYLAPGDCLNPHRHAPAEIYFIIEGRPIVTIDGVDHVAPPDSLLFIPGNAEHGVRNAGPDPVKFFYCFAVDRFGDVEYRFPPVA